MTPTRKCTLKEMLEGMSHLKDDEPFRWYQVSKVLPDHGWHGPVETLLVTVGQARAEISQLLKGVENDE